MVGLGLNEAMLLSRIGVLKADADQKMTALEREIYRLREIVAHKDAVIAAQERRAKADACSIAGYRAYVDQVRSDCEGEVLVRASDAYIVANDAKADELKAPHLKKVKTASRLIKQAA
jgi:hypothetical protein